MKGAPRGRLVKRSVVLTGHATSIALEPAFWTVLEDLARARGLSLARTVAAIDAARAEAPLASACRLAALEHVRAS